MQYKKAHDEKFELSVSLEEAEVITNVLNEIANGVDWDDTVIQAHVGVERKELLRLLELFTQMLQTE